MASSLALLSLALASYSSASIIPRASEADGKFLSLPIKRLESSGSTGLERRDDVVTLMNATQVTYLFELQIGTPPQKVDVVLDTGSFELWVDPTCSTASTSDQIKQCQNAGTYTPKNSKTVQDQSQDTTLTYGKGQVEIEYVSDNVIVTGSNSSAMQDVVFGLGQGSQDLTFGIAGVGHGYGFNLEYYNLVDELARNNVTNGRQFSVALASKDASNGGLVMFGGIDTKKFTGPLYKFTNLPPQTESGTKKGPWRYWVQMNSLGITKPGSSSSTNYSSSSIPVVLDTGSTLSYLPKSVVTQLGTDLGATTASDGSLVVPCSLASQSGTVDFTFGQFTLKVPYHEFIWEVSPNQCYAGVVPQSSSTTALLGDSFLRSAYVVMDQDNQAIYMAPYSNCGQNEKTFVPGSNYTGECAAASTKPSAAGRLGASTGMWAALAIGVVFQVVMATL